MSVGWATCFVRIVIRTIVSGPLGKPAFLVGLSKMLVCGHFADIADVATDGTAAGWGVSPLAGVLSPEVAVELGVGVGVHHRLTVRPQPGVRRTGKAVVVSRRVVGVVGGLPWD
jgi:uncharacterized membrane protein YczE